MIAFIFAWLLSAAMFGLTLRISIAFVDPENRRNSYKTAFFFGIFFALLATAAGMFASLFSLVALMMLLVKYYDIPLLRSFLTLLVMGLVGWLIQLGVGMLAGLLGIS